MKLIKVIAAVVNLPFMRAVFAEFLGTTVFLFVSLATSISQNQPTLSSSTQVSLSFGISVTVMSYCVGQFSGAHLNPAVTIAMLAGLRLSLPRAVCFISAQLLGAIAASALLYGLIPPNIQGNLGINLVSPSVTLFQAVILEMIITFQLVLCIFVASDPRRVNSMHFAIGLSVILGHLAAIRYTGCGMNPARSFGPAVVTFNFQNHWNSFQIEVTFGSEIQRFIRMETRRASKSAANWRKLEGILSADVEHDLSLESRDLL
ncbi:aquaporin-5-like [Protopterus annectens]|uniref:aquaporin-5-like n=1 Tax=Protopterus annectens TaxID=7888 RepID=UPI001CF9E25A|nr:aquaporin-5-like [Protopterus annectens]